MRRMTSNCWKSFSPKKAHSARESANSFATTVHTPRKCPGRRAPHSGCASGPGSTYDWKPAGYISSGPAGAKTNDAPAASDLRRSPSRSRG